MEYARNLSPEDYRRAKADAIRTASRQPDQTEATMKRLRAKYPDLKDRADAENTTDEYKAELRLIGADLMARRAARETGAA